MKLDMGVIYTYWTEGEIRDGGTNTDGGMQSLQSCSELGHAHVHVRLPD